MKKTSDAWFLKTIDDELIVVSEINDTRDIRYGEIC